MANRFKKPTDAEVKDFDRQFRSTLLGRAMAGRFADADQRALEAKQGKAMAKAALERKLNSPGVIGMWERHKYRSESAITNDKLLLKVGDRYEIDANDRPKKEKNTFLIKVPISIALNTTKIALGIGIPTIALASVAGFAYVAHPLFAGMGHLFMQGNVMPGIFEMTAGVATGIGLSYGKQKISTMSVDVSAEDKKKNRRALAWTLGLGVVAGGFLSYEFVNWINPFVNTTNFLFATARDMGVGYLLLGTVEGLGFYKIAEGFRNTGKFFTIWD
jgi:hypothetical protein